MLKKISKILLLIPVILIFSSCSLFGNQNNSNPKNEQLAGEVQGVAYKVKGSCNMIDKASQCLDYLGAMWTEAQMELNCGSNGNFSTSTCPESTLGGCNIASGEITESIMWSYEFGGDPITPEILKVVKNTCNTLPQSSWISTTDLIKQ